MTQQQQQTKALTQVSNAQAVLDQAQIDPRLIMAAKAIQLMAGQDDSGNPKVSADMALAAAMYQAGTGQLLGRDFYVNDKMGRIEGYRGVSRDAVDRGVGEVQIKYRPLADDEAEEHEIAAGDTAVACEVYQLRAWRLAQSMGQRYEPIVGIGVVRKIEKYDKKSTYRWDDNARRSVQLPESQWRIRQLEGGMTWRKIAQNRAYKEALRHVPGGLDSAAEILEEAALCGVPQPPETARLTVEQAQEWVRLNEDGGPDGNEIDGMARVPEGARVVYDGPHAYLEPDPEFVPPSSRKPAPSRRIDVVARVDDATDAEFNALPSASAERAAGNGKPAPAQAAAPKNNADAPWNDTRKAEAVRWAMRTYPGVYNAPQHAANSLDNCIEENVAKGASAAEIAQAWKDKVHAKFLEAQAAQQAQQATEDKPRF